MVDQSNDKKTKLLDEFKNDIQARAKAVKLVQQAIDLKIADDSDVIAKFYMSNFGSFATCPAYVVFRILTAANVKQIKDDDQPDNILLSLYTVLARSTSSFSSLGLHHLTMYLKLYGPNPNEDIKLQYYLLKENGYAILEAIQEMLQTKPEEWTKRSGVLAYYSSKSQQPTEQHRLEFTDVMIPNEVWKDATVVQVVKDIASGGGILVKPQDLQSLKARSNSKVARVVKD